MKKILPLLLFASLISNICLAGTDAISLNKGEPAPWDGILLTPSRAQLARKAEQDLPQYKLLNESLQHSLDLEKNNNDFISQKNDILLKDNVMLSDALEKARSSNDLIKILYFIGGAGVVLLGAEVASKVR